MADAVVNVLKFNVEPRSGNFLSETDLPVELCLVRCWPKQSRQFMPIHANSNCQPAPNHCIPCQKQPNCGHSNSPKMDNAMCNLHIALQGQHHQTSGGQSRREASRLACSTAWFPASCGKAAPKECIHMAVFAIGPPNSLYLNR